MALSIDLNLPTREPSESFLTLSNFKRGVITLVDQSNLPKNALKEANNIFLYEEGTPGIRPGLDWFGVASPNGEAWQGMEYFADDDGSNHLVGVAGGNVYRSTDDAETWDLCSGATLDTSAEVNMNQNGGYLYLTNGVDNIVRYDGTTTLDTYSALSTPSAPSVSESMTGTSRNYYYKCARVNNIGFSIASSASAAATTDLDRSNWDSTTNKVTLTLPAFAGDQTRYDIYISDDDTTYYYLASTATTSYVDDGTAIPIPGNTAPDSSTAQGPTIAELTNVGGRMYGVRDADNEYRIWFTGAGNNAGSFSSSYDGGWLEWLPGGKEKPVHVEDYRDGKGTPYATIWCDTPDGQGAIIQMSLDEVTISDVIILVPNAYRLPGSRGTPAPHSVVNVLNDYMFYNSQAYYNLGSRAQYLNLLSTDESSSNIRPTVKTINQAAESGIASIYYDARVYFSYPSGSSTNNFTAIYDTERKAWLPKAFTKGFKKFLKYTDNSANKTKYLLALKPGDNRLTKIDYNLTSDYGESISTSLITGLYSTDNNRFAFQWVEEAEMEFSQPQGSINVELIGIERSKGFSSTKTETVVGQTVDAGWDTFAWDTTVWDDTSVTIQTYSESSVKRYFNVQRDLNAIQWRITTNSTDAKYLLRTLQTHGTVTNSGKPRQWRL